MAFLDLWAAQADAGVGWTAALVALAAVAAGAAAAAAWAAWTLARRVRELDARAAPLAHLEALARDVHGLAADRGDLDLRRVEHVLIELRDGQARLEDALLRHAEATREALVRGATEGLVLAGGSPGGGDGLGERAINRLLALGYDKVQLVTRVEKLAEIAGRDGEILVEARRNGVLHKGRVAIRQGRIANVELAPAYSIFP